MRFSAFRGLGPLAFWLLPCVAAQAAIPTTVTPRNFFGALLFNRPVHVEAVPGKDSAFVVLEQWLSSPTSTGQLTYVRYENGNWVKSAFDTVTFSGSVSSNREMGLLGFAFHPNYAQNRKYYLTYTPSYSESAVPPTRLLLLERRADSTLAKRNAAVASRTILNVPQSGNTQKGGQIAFGPADGYLYVGLGDGGGTGDLAGRAQNADSLQGKILRINIDSAEAGKEYAVPADNPAVTGTGKKEVWVKGVRNPWRWTIHPVRNELWVGEVGADVSDEVSLAPKGGNLGWNVREGASCYPSDVTSCAGAGLTAPVYTRSPQSLIGGVFFLGNASAAFHDAYIFGNNAGGQIYAMRFNNGTIADAAVQIATITNVSSFGKDRAGRVLAVRLGTTTGQSVNANTGSVQVLESPDMTLAPVAIRPGNAGRRADAAVSLVDYRRDPAAYTVRALDGRQIRGPFKGAALIRKKDSSFPPQLVPFVW